MPAAVIAPTDPSRSFRWLLVKGGGWLRATGTWHLVPVEEQVGLADLYAWADSGEPATLLRLDTIGGWCDLDLPPEGRTMSPSRTSTSSTLVPAQTRGRAAAGSGTLVLGGTRDVVVPLDTSMPSPVYDAFPAVVGTGVRVDSVVAQTVDSVTVRIAATVLLSLTSVTVKVWCTQ